MDSATSRRVDEFIETLPQPQQAIAGRLRSLLLDLVPGIEERFRFEVPFYDYHGMFCYLHFNRAGLHLCFCRGKELLMAFPQLELKNRAAIASVTLREEKDIQQLEISHLVIAAAAWGKEAAALKIPMIKKRQTQSQHQMPRPQRANRKR